MAMSGGSPAMMRGSYTGQMAPAQPTGGQGMQQQGSGDSSQTQAQPQRNTAFLCKVGCETVQEVVMRTSEVFTHLKNVQLPNGTTQGAQMSNEKKARIQDNLNAIQRHFKPLRAIYTRVNDDCAGMEYTHIEASDEGRLWSLIPYKDDGDSRADHKKIGDNYRYLVEESRELKEARDATNPVSLGHSSCSFERNALSAPTASRRAPDAWLPNDASVDEARWASETVMRFGGSSDPSSRYIASASAFFSAVGKRWSKRTMVTSGSLRYQKCQGKVFTHALPISASWKSRRSAASFKSFAGAKEATGASNQRVT
ncbi:Mediator of RNA polymerase II transcription subunit 30 [Chionoecetes opilio]|uniref:Mediator of RNA polymerase II transcription subunit 30 n=1 Tax=Chionoecetes opilio TaxID=41210 RepID=A0A8J4XZR3_CHIOP|nr:Mediator of RNA polymerase II transcription subunit 30 [Chionoecetes opilio]